ncbi:hypothetical protein [Streptomyces acidicola]|uniref:hypothetical protein n=1 Tax=Streptomyces acidicola TaxID=2596892 RepID=UPI0038016158
MRQTEKPQTMLGHGELPFPKGTLVMDTFSERTGELQGVIEERLKGTGQLVSQMAFLRPRGGGIEWDTPLEHIEPVDNP